MYILGINAYHGDSSACLVRDGEVLMAVEEERYRRVKHWAGFPSMSIQACLEYVGVSLSDIDHVAINRDPKANILKKAAYAALSRPDLSLIRDRVKNARKWGSISEELADAFPDQRFSGQVHHVEHHLAHMASSFFVSPFDEAVAVSVDGFGDFASAAWAVGRGRSLDTLGKVFFPHSLGVFYQAITQFIGFPHYGDEYKMMGLAPYGEPKYLEEMRKIVLLRKDGSFRLDLKHFRHHRENVEYEWTDGSPSVGILFSDALKDLLGPDRSPSDELTQRHKDMARSAQAMFEEALFHLLNTIQPSTGLKSLVMAGGCAMNSVANGKITRATPFEAVYIQAAAGDAGGAVGAAMSVASKVDPDSRLLPMKHASLGPEFSSDQISDLLRSSSQEIEAKNCVVEPFEGEEALIEKVSEAIAGGKVIGWFQGRMEWGPRALGNRSIVADPRRADMKDILNLKIKRRESFRPFAPSVVREAVSEWFEVDDDVPFMMKVFPIREDKRQQIPAVTHVDGSGRLQTVTEDTNSRYYKLIKSFERRTGVPMVLNTSFNENEPVVRHPKEALDCFLRTKMDLLVLGDHVIRRSAD